MENDVFRRPAVAGLLKEKVIESRQHSDFQGKLTEAQFTRNKKMQAELVGNEQMPYFVLWDPVTKKTVRTMKLGSPGSWESAFIAFLNGSEPR